MAGWTCSDNETNEWAGTISVRNNLNVGNNGIFMGNVGIKTASPSFSLDVNGNVIGLGTKTANSGLGGNIRFRDDTGTVRWLSGIGGSPAQTTWVLYDVVNSKQPITVEANVPANALYLQTISGAIGINTATPTAGYFLTLKESAGNSAGISMVDTDNTPYGIVGMARATDDYGITGVANVDLVLANKWGSGRVILGTANNINMMITGTGVVGIGTTTPSSLGKLEVSGSIWVPNATALYFRDLNAAITQAGFIYYGADNGMQIGTNNTDRLHIASGGNVGIGATSPGEKLDVVGKIYVEDTGTNYPTIRFQNTNGIIVGGKTAAGVGVDTLNIFNGGSGLSVLNGGNVGIGTTAPSALLTVSGANCYVLMNTTTGSALQLKADATRNSIQMVDGRPLFIESNGGVIVGSIQNDGSMQASGSGVFKKNGASGTGGSFTTADSKTVTVSGGIIISIV